MFKHCLVHEVLFSKNPICRITKSQLFLIVNFPCLIRSHRLERLREKIKKKHLLSFGFNTTFEYAIIPRTQKTCLIYLLSNHLETDLETVLPEFWPMPVLEMERGEGTLALDWVLSWCFSDRDLLTLTVQSTII